MSDETTPQDDRVIPDYADAEPLIDANRVVAIFMDCLWSEAEAEDLPKDEDGVPEGTVIVEGILSRFGFNPAKLEEHRNEVAMMLRNLPEAFLSTANGGGGGWSFLQACDDRNHVQWTGLHRTMDNLFSLGLGMDLVVMLVPRDGWEMLPGGMPYYMVTA